MMFYKKKKKEFGKLFHWTIVISLMANNKYCVGLILQLWQWIHDNLVLDELLWYLDNIKLEIMNKHE
jgi:hypothetical protein